MITTSDLLYCKGCKHAKVEVSYNHYCKLNHCIYEKEGVKCRTCPHFVEDKSEKIECGVNLMLPVVAAMAGKCYERENNYEHIKLEEQK